MHINSSLAKKRRLLTSVAYWKTKTTQRKLQKENRPRRITSQYCLRLRRSRTKTKIACAERERFFFFSLDPHNCFTPAAEKGAAQENHGASSRTMSSHVVKEIRFTTKTCASAAFEYLFYGLLSTRPYSLSAYLRRVILIVQIYRAWYLPPGQ